MKKRWESKALGELCEIELGKTPARANASFWDDKRETGNVWLSIADLLKAEDNVVVNSKEYISDKGAAICKLVLKGTLLVSFKLTLGRLAFAGRDLFTNEAIAALTIFNERELSKEFLFYSLSFFDWVKAAENDVKLKGMTLNKAKLKVMPVSFPPLAEQQRIVGILDEAFAGIARAKANAEQNLQNARALFESHLQAVFSQRGEGWVQKPFEKVVHVDCSLSYGIVQPGEEYANGLPIVRPTDLGAGTIYLDGLKRINPKIAGGYNRTTLQGHELLLCVRGSTGVVSKAAPELAGGNVTRGIVPIRFDSKLITQDFGYYLIRSETVQSQIREKTYGTALMQINIRDLRVLELSLPPIKEQTSLVEKLDALSEETRSLAAIYERKLAALEELKKSLLHQAFSGEL
jgi:type I restriction enzyme S subunit